MNRPNQTGGYLLFEDGTRYPGEIFLGDTPAFGEAVFNTSHTGYQEIITDPSYHRQLVVFTAPHIGNVGVNDQDSESTDQRAAGIIVRSLAPVPRNWRAQQSLSDWMQEQALPMLVGANTRAITLHLRQRGTMRAGLFPNHIALDDALAQVTDSDSMVGADLANQVSCDQSYEFTVENLSESWHPRHDQGAGLHVAVLDFGVKKNILAELTTRGCRVTVLPATTTADDILAGSFDGVMLSNGPGDPQAVTYGIETARRLLEAAKPIFGICLGHQLLALAAGGRSFKLPFGHRGANHPVRQEEDQTIEITSQNHGFAIRAEGLGDDWRVSHVNLNDGTVEGLAHKSLPAFSIQYHPEASPGPHEGHRYFDQFIREMHRAKA